MLIMAAGTVSGDAPRAARSVHLAYEAPAGATFYNEVTVEESQRGSYFMACGFDGGYFGIQELGDGNKWVLFSVWEPGNQNDPGRVPEEKRVKVLGSGEGVTVRRFGGEGTGAQSFMIHPWKIGETYRFRVQASVTSNLSTYAAYFYRPEDKRWQHMATFQTRNEGKLLESYYSFIEDFRRDGRSATERRLARFGNGWITKPDGKSVPLTRAKFTADDTPLNNIDAGVKGNEFYLATGGDTKNTTKLWSIITRALPASSSR